MEKDTPRTLIEGLINASQTNETKRPVRKRQVSKTPELDNRLSHSLPSTEISLGQRYEDIPRNKNSKQHFHEMEKDLNTPRTLIQGLIDAAQTNETERPVRKRRVSRTPEVDTRLSRSLSSAEISLGQRSEDIPNNVTEDSTPRKRKFVGKRRESLVDSVRRKRFHFQNSELSTSLSNTPNEIAVANSLGEPRRKSPRLANQIEILSSTTELSSVTSSVLQLRSSRRKREKPKFIFSMEKDSSKLSQQEQEAYSLRSYPVKQMPQRSSPRKQSHSLQRLRSSQVKQTAPRTPPQKRPKSVDGQMPSPVKQITPKSSPRKQLKSVQSPRSFPAKQITPRSSPRTLPKSVQKQQNLSSTESASVLSTPKRTMLVSSTVTTPSRILTSTPRRVQPLTLNDENSGLAVENIPSNRSSLSILRSSAQMSENDENLTDSQRKNNASLSKKTPEETTESVSRGLENEVTEESLVVTPNINEEQTPRTPIRQLGSADFHRVKQSTFKTPTQTEMKSPSRMNATPVTQRNLRKLASSEVENIVNRTMPTRGQTGNNEGPLHETPGRETVMTPAFEKTALGPRHSSPVSRTLHISLTGDENLSDISMIERQEKTFYQDDLDRTEQYRLKTPHLGPARPHVPTPSDTPVPEPPVTQPVKEKPTNRSKATRKPRVKVESLTLPAMTIRQTFNHFCKMRVDKDMLSELVKITDEYFDRVAQDLEAFAHHAGRKTIDERDAELLLKRQKIITNTTSLTNLVEKYLPMELRQEIIPMARSGNKIFPGN